MNATIFKSEHLVQPCQRRAQRIVSRIARNPAAEGPPDAGFVRRGGVRDTASMVGGAGGTLAVGHGVRSVLSNHIRIGDAERGEGRDLDRFHRPCLVIVEMVIP